MVWAVAELAFPGACAQVHTAGSAEAQRLMHGPANGPLLGRQLVANALVDGLELCLSTQTRNFGLVPKQTPYFLDLSSGKITR